jgi:hypothetical protein
MFLVRTLVIVYDGTSNRFYELIVGTGDSVLDKIEPDDYDDFDNLKYWQLIKPIGTHDPTTVKATYPKRAIQMQTSKRYSII